MGRRGKRGPSALLLLFLLGMFLRRVLSAGGKPPVPQLQPTVLLPVSVGQDVPLDPSQLILLSSLQLPKYSQFPRREVQLP